uniref:Uncharacterized protein n=1 Tax=Anolis carolinensis TaxID=28377 RepID=A0A803T0S6_ANOCA
MYVCVSISIYIHMHTHKHIYTHTYIYTHILEASFMAEIHGPSMYMCCVHGYLCICIHIHTHMKIYWLSPRLSITGEKPTAAHAKLTVFWNH